MFFKTGVFDTTISSKKVVIESRAGVIEAKICLKTAENCKYSYLQFNNSNTIEFLKHIFVSFGKIYLRTMISSEKVVIEPTAGVNEAEIFPKTA